MPETDEATLPRVAPSDIASASGIFKIKNPLFTWQNLRYIVLKEGWPGNGSPFPGLALQVSKWG
jgi:hypothetical protein